MLFSLSLGEMLSLVGVCFKGKGVRVRVEYLARLEEGFVGLGEAKQMENSCPEQY